jgi:Pectate lyase superfamily protein
MTPKIQTIWLSALTLLLLVLGVGLYKTRTRPPPEVLSPQVAHLLATPLGPSQFAFYANQRAIGRYWITDPLFAGGAVGDGVHDDTAAIAATLVAAQGAYTGDAGVTTAGSVYAPTAPGGVNYKVTAPIPINYPACIIGDSNTSQQTIFKAYAPMTTMFPIRSTFGQVDPFGANESIDRVILRDFTIDGNSMVNDPLLFIGSEWSIITNIRLRKGIHSCWRAVNTMLPLVLTTVTPGGGGVGGVTVTQSDPYYQDAQQDGTVPFVLKVDGAGALDTAKVVISRDNGATYALGDQPLSAATNLMIADAAGAQTLYGITAHFPPRTYALNETYSFSATTQSADFGLSEAAVAEMTMRDIETAYCGPVYATAGLAGAYNGYNLTVVGGSCSTVSGSQRITCAGGPSLHSFVGDGFSRGVITLNNQQFQVAGVLTDTIFAVVPGEEPQFTLSGLDYAYAAGGGVYEDGHLEGPDDHWDSGNSNFDSICYQFNGLIGPAFFAPTLSACALAGVSVGGGNTSSMTHSTFINFHIASQAGGSGASFLISPNSTGQIIEPSGAFTVSGNSSGWIIPSGGLIGPLQNAFTAQSFLQQYFLSIAPSFQTLTTAGQQIVLPGFTAATAGGHTGFVRMTASSNFTLTATPTIPSPPGDTAGVWLVIQNDGFNVITFQSDAETANGLLLEAPFEALSYKEIMAFISTGLHNVPWREAWRPTSAYGDGSRVGNTGQARFRVQTVSSTTPVQLYRVNVINSGVAPGTELEFKVSAQSQGGANIAWWLGCRAAWSPTGVRITSNVGASPGVCTSAFGYTGGVAGGIPLGWALTIDPSGTTPYAHIFFAGDSSANPVTATIVVDHLDPGQQDILPQIDFSAFSDPCLPRRRRRADNDNDFEELLAA